MERTPSSRPYEFAISRASAGFDRPVKMEIGVCRFDNCIESDLRACCDGYPRAAPAWIYYHAHDNASNTDFVRCPGRIRTSTYGSKGRCPAIRRPGKNTGFPVQSGKIGRTVTGSQRIRGNRGWERVALTDSIRILSDIGRLLPAGDDSAGRIGSC